MSSRTVGDVINEIRKKQKKLREQFESDPVGVYQLLRPYFLPYWVKGYRHPSPEIVGVVFLDFAALFGIKSLKETNELLAKHFNVDPRQIKRWKEKGQGEFEKKLSSIGQERWHEFLKFIGILPDNLDENSLVPSVRRRESKDRSAYFSALKESILKWSDPVFPPSASATDTFERALGEALVRFTNPLDDWYDPEFSLELREAQDTWYGFKTLEKKRAILAWPDHKDRPNPDSEDPAEREVAVNLRSYISPASSAFDAKFSLYVKTERRAWFADKTEEKKKAILAWFDMENPPHPDALGIEGELGRAYRNYTNRNGLSYDAQFDSTIREMRPKWRKATRVPSQSKADSRRV